MSAPFAIPSSLPFVPLSLPQARRVLRSAEFRSTYQSGTRIANRYFVAFCVRDAESATPSRFGFTCPRALGKAVVRNRIRRRMREAVRAEWDGLGNGWILVFNPRRAAADAAFLDLRREVSRVFSKCNSLSSVS